MTKTGENERKTQIQRLLLGDGSCAPTHAWDCDPHMLQGHAAWQCPRLPPSLATATSGRHHCP